MLSLVLIDDDMFNLEYLERLISWDTFGFQAPVCFSNSLQAIEYLKKNTVEAIVTDIKMPSPTGLDIASFCAQNSPKTKIMLFSAYRDFEYARMAIQLRNIIDYIQKPINYDEFTEKLNILAKACLLETRQNNFITNEKMNQSLQFFSNLFYGHIKDTNQLKSELVKLDVYCDIYTTPCTRVKFNINNFSEYLSNTWRHDISKFYYAITKMYPSETDSGYFLLSGYSFNIVEWVILHKELNTKKTLDSFCDNMIDRVKSLLQIDISLYSVQTTNSISTFLYETSDFIVEHDTSKDGNSIIENAYKYMSEHYNEDINLSEVADHVYMSSSYFSLFFKKATGKNFIVALTEIRMQNVIKLLNEKSYSIEAICDMVGYKNVGHFRKLFKRYFGITPSKYQKQSKGIGDISDKNIKRHD